MPDPHATPAGGGAGQRPARSRHFGELIQGELEHEVQRKALCIPLDRLIQHLVRCTGMGDWATGQFDRSEAIQQNQEPQWAKRPGRFVNWAREERRRKVGRPEAAVASRRSVRTRPGESRQSADFPDRLRGRGAPGMVEVPRERQVEPELGLQHTLHTEYRCDPIPSRCVPTRGNCLPCVVRKPPAAAITMRYGAGSRAALRNTGSGRC